ncbi:MAG: acetolactate synthase 3 large subunit, partial [Pseudomonadota bacterium]
GQVARKLIGTDAFQECDTVGITRACTKHNYLVPSAHRLPTIVHEAFHVACEGRPGPVLIDVPKDVQFEEAPYVSKGDAVLRQAGHRTEIRARDVETAVDLMRRARRPVFYTGGGVINAGPRACEALRDFVRAAGFPITSTLMGLGAYPASGENWIGMLGMHGLYEANLAMHGCDLMINIGARFDDRITGRVQDFSPKSKKVHIDIDPSSINKVIHADVPIIGDVGHVLEDALKIWKARGRKTNKEGLNKW